MLKNEAATRSSKLKRMASARFGALRASATNNSDVGQALRTNSRISFRSFVSYLPSTVKAINASLWGWSSSLA